MNVVVLIIAVALGLIFADMLRDRLIMWAEQSRAEEEQDQLKKYLDEKYHNIDIPAYMRTGRWDGDRSGR